MKAESAAGHHFRGGLLLWSALAFVAAGLFRAFPLAAESTNSSQEAPSAQQAFVPPSAPEIADLKTKASAGDAMSQMRLGKAYLKGAGVPRNEGLAFQWMQKAAEQGNAGAENDLGTMYRLGEGVASDKALAVRWYQKAARHGSAEGMFNLGTCHYNGDGVGSNEYTAYVWFLLAQEAGDPVADDAVRRSQGTMTKKDIASAFITIAKMYQQGEELPKDDVRFLSWMHKAADLDSSGKVGLAVYLLTGPEGERDYTHALDLCKTAAKDYVPALPCVGYIYRKGLGVPQDSMEAAKWYEKGANNSNPVAMMVMAELLSSGEGTHVDRAAALLLLFRASGMGVTGAKQKANDLLQQLSKTELKQAEKKLRDVHFDPAKVFAAIQSPPPS